MDARNVPKILVASANLSSLTTLKLVQSKEFDIVVVCNIHRFTISGEGEGVTIGTCREFECDKSLLYDLK